MDKAKSHHLVTIIIVLSISVVGNTVNYDRVDRSTSWMRTIASSIRFSIGIKPFRVCGHLVSHPVQNSPLLPPSVPWCQYG